MSKKGLIGVQMSTIAPAKMPALCLRCHAKLVDLGYHCAETFPGSHDQGNMWLASAGPLTSWASTSLL